jgi:transposase
VVIGFAMTRQGIPVRCWTWWGNTGDQTVIEEVKRDLNGWKLGRVVTMADAGFNSAENRRILQQAGITSSASDCALERRENPSRPSRAAAVTSPTTKAAK